jgi:hypothetical protein
MSVYRTICAPMIMYPSRISYMLPCKDIGYSSWEVKVISQSVLGAYILTLL